MERDKYFLGIAELISKRSTCVRRSVGAVIVKDNRIVSTGYNGTPKGLKHCTVEDCIRNIQKIPSGTRHELCKGVHAEMNAVVFANRYDLEGADIYVTVFPCVFCMKVIINSGIKRIIYSGNYDDELSKEIVGQTDIVCWKI